MNIVERPNQEALTKAIVIYLDAIRPFVTRNLKQVSGRSVEEAVLQSLPPDKAEYFLQNRPMADSLESAIEASHVEFILGHYWMEVFALLFRNNDVVFGKLRCVTAARNQVSHPAFRKDQDVDETLDYLDALVFLLGTIGSNEESEAVAAIRAEVANPGEAGNRSSENFVSFEEQYQKTVVELEETKGFLWQVESELDATKRKLRDEEFARANAEKEAHAAQGSLGQLKEELREMVEVRKGAEVTDDEKARALRMAEQTTQQLRRVLKQSKKRLSVAMARFENAKRRAKNWKEHTRRPMSLRSKSRVPTP